jgi:hypothetical protein
VRNTAQAGKFYDAALKPLGYKRLYDSPEALGYGAKEPEFWVMQVERPVKEDVASGLHFCFDADSKTGADAFHVAALKSGRN